MSISLKGQRVLVIGAAGGIGHATATVFAQAGAELTAAGRPGPELDAAAVEMGAEPAALDILDAEAAEAFFVGRVPFEHVVVAASSTKTGSVANLALVDAKAAMESKFWGAYRIARFAKINEGGSLTFVSGFLARRPSAESVLQGAINAALEGLARGLALELAPTRVNAISPGLIDTPLYAGMSNGERQAMFDKAAARLPARRVGQPEDIAQAILFVAGSSFVTGSTIIVDGGGTIA